MEKLDGYKTYITAGLVALTAFAHAMGWINDTVYQTALAVLGAGGLAALRSAVAKGGF